MTVRYAGTKPANEYYLLWVSHGKYSHDSAELFVVGKYSNDITDIETESTNMKLNGSSSLCYCLYE